jgi:hypothetical protein
MDWAPLVAAALLFGGTVFTVRAGRSNKLDEREEQERTRLSARIERLEKRVHDLERHGRIQDDYIRHLRNHIDAGNPPPPPPWPDGLGGTA